MPGTDKPHIALPVLCRHWGVCVPFTPKVRNFGCAFYSFTPPSTNVAAASSQRLQYQA